MRLPKMDSANAMASRANSIKRSAVARNQLIRIGSEIVSMGYACDRPGCTSHALRAMLKQRPTWADLERRFRQ